MYIISLRRYIIVDQIPIQVITFSKQGYRYCGIWNIESTFTVGHCFSGQNFYISCFAY